MIYKYRKPVIVKPEMLKAAQKRNVFNLWWKWTREGAWQISASQNARVTGPLPRRSCCSLTWDDGTESKVAEADVEAQAVLHCGESVLKVMRHFYFENISYNKLDTIDPCALPFSRYQHIRRLLCGWCSARPGCIYIWRWRSSSWHLRRWRTKWASPGIWCWWATDIQRAIQR